jgi:hypothetical protein
VIFDLNQSLSSLRLYRRHSDDLVNSHPPWWRFFVLLTSITDARAVVCAHGVYRARRAAPHGAA